MMILQILKPSRCPLFFLLAIFVGNMVWAADKEKELHEMTADDFMEIWYSETAKNINAGLREVRANPAPTNEHPYFKCNFFNRVHVCSKTCRGQGYYDYPNPFYEIELEPIPYHDGANRIVVKKVRESSLTLLNEAISNPWIGYEVPPKQTLDLLGIQLSNLEPLAVFLNLLPRLNREIQVEALVRGETWLTTQALSLEEALKLYEQYAHKDEDKRLLAIVDKIERQIETAAEEEEARKKTAAEAEKAEKFRLFMARITENREKEEREKEEQRNKEIQEVEEKNRKRMEISLRIAENLKKQEGQETKEQERKKQEEKNANQQTSSQSNPSFYSRLYAPQPAAASSTGVEAKRASTTPSSASNQGKVDDDDYLTKLRRLARGSGGIKD